MPGDLVLPLVIATVFGMFAAMGLLSSCMGGLTMLAQPTYPPMPPPMQESFDLIMSRSMMLTWVSTALSVVLMLPTAVLLLGGALLTVMKNPIGGRFLSAGFVWAPIAEGLFFVYGLAVQAWILAPTMDLLDAVTQIPTNTGQPMPSWIEHMGTFTMVILGVALLVSVAWLGIKLAAYLWAGRRVRSDEVQAWFASLAEG